MKRSSVTPYEAIMGAADKIERKPHLFDWSSTEVGGCRTPGCAVGWICAFRGQKPREAFNCEQALGIDAPVFYARMDALCGVPHTDDHWGPWKDSAAECARVLRLYAEKWHASEKQPRPTSAMVADLMARVSGEQTVSTEAQSEELSW